MKIKYFIFLITMGLLCVTQAQNQHRQHTPKHQQQEENILQVEQLQQTVENKAFYNDYVDTLITYDTSLTPINR
ncbi:MAG: hypothetical protein GX330_00995 [Bacteroidales bacterium]|nr:hypothetical protein [Bacteroidales bacterium]